MSKSQEFIIKDGVLLSYRGNSTEVIVPEGVHTIDGFAFVRDKKKIIERVQLPESLEVIEDWAFDYCEKLERIVIPSGVKEIGEGAFCWCRALKEVVIEGDPKIGDSAFCWTPWEKAEFKKSGAKINGDVLLRVDPELTEYTIPSHIKIIGRDAFKNSKVKEIDVPYGVTKLDICAFAYSDIERISLPETLKIVDAYAFASCTNLTELTIPKSVTRIGDNAFAELPNCTLTILNESDDEELFRIAPDSFGMHTPHIKEVRVSYGSVAMRCAMKRGLNVAKFPCDPERFGNPKKYHYIDDMFCCEGSTLYEYFGHEDIVYVPDGIRKIGDNAFNGADIKKVYLPESVRRIEEFGFASCKELTEVVGEGIQEMDWYAFRGCKKLLKAEFPKLEKCYDISFDGCISLKRESLIIPAEATVIEVEFKACGCGYMHTKRTPFSPEKGESEIKFSDCSRKNDIGEFL